MEGACRNAQSVKDARKIKGNIVKYQLPCGIENQEITAQIKNNVCGFKCMPLRINVSIITTYLTLEYFGLNYRALRKLFVLLAQI
jgi:hypothetical protein